MFVECRAAAREDGPEHLKPVGETEFVARVARFRIGNTRFLSPEAVAARPAFTPAFPGA